MLGSGSRQGEIRKEKKSFKGKKSPGITKDGSQASPKKSENQSGSKPKEDPSYASKKSRRNYSLRTEDTKAGPVDSEDAEENRVSLLIQKLLEFDRQTMATTLEELEEEMSTNYLPDSLIEWARTFSGAVANIIKNGKTNAASLAAKVAALMCAQLGGLNNDNVDVDRMYQEDLRPALLDKLKDKSAESSLRALCAEAIGIGELIAIDVPKMVEEILEELLSLVLNLSGGKGVDISPEAATVCIAALRSWCVVLTGTSSVSIMEHSITRFAQFQDLLESSNAELRVASGKAMALLCELAEQVGEDLTPTEELCATFRDLAKDKKVDVKYEQQRTFRDVIKTYEEGEAFSFERKINTEVLYIDSWVQKIQYDAFCRILGAGMNSHLKGNVLIRSKFNLDSPLLEPQSKKPNAKEKRLSYAAAFKARSKSKQTFRDKRTDYYVEEPKDEEKSDKKKNQKSDQKKTSESE